MCVAKIEQYSMKCRKQCNFFANGVAWCTIPCDRSQYCLIKKRKIFFSVLPWGAVCVRSEVPDQIQYSSNEGCRPGRYSMYEMIFTSPITTDPASVVCQPCFVNNNQILKLTIFNFLSSGINGALTLFVLLWPAYFLQDIPYFGVGPNKR